MRIHFLVVALLSSCVTALGPAPKRSNPVIAPQCDGTPDLDPPAERGAVAFGSEAELAAARGKTVYLISSQELPEHGARLGIGIHALFGEPLLLCDTTAGRNQHLVVDEKIARAKSVLAKTPGGVLVDVDVALISPRMPRFSLAAPTEPVDMIVAAFNEAADADQRLVEPAPPHGEHEYDRAFPAFWARIARANADSIRGAARQIIRQLVGGMGEYKRTIDRRGERIGQVIVNESGSALAYKGEDGAAWVVHANPAVQRLMQFGIPRGPVRVAYDRVARCEHATKERNDECAAAAAVIAAPPPIPAEATAGGTIKVRVAPKRLLAQVELEVDGQPVKLTEDSVTVPVSNDGDHTIHAVAPGMRMFDRHVNVQFGQAVEVPIVFLPK